MNHDEQALRRLLKAAGRSQPEWPEAMPFALEARILAQWRRGVVESDATVLVAVFRRATIWAGVIMVVSIGWSQLNAVREVPGAAALAKLERAIPFAP
jgi:hypothetical protein